MHDFAHRLIGSARWCAWSWLLVAAAPQDLAPAPRYADVDALAVRALEAKDPTTRGEAALWLADSGKHEHYEAILRTAKDLAPAARYRGILAAGRLGVPGCESFLGKLLLDRNAEQPEAAIAAFALGQLEDSAPAPAIDGLLRRVQGGSKKRNEAVLAALLGGLATRPHPSRATTLQSLLDDASNRSEAITLLAHAGLQVAGAAPVRAQLIAWLDSPHAGVRVAALAACAADRRLLETELPHVRRLARADADPEVRAAALHLVALQLDGSAIDLADRALGSRSPVEVAAAAEVLIGLTGSARRRIVEDRALETSLPPEVRAALLDALSPPLTPRLLLFCHDTAHDANSAPVLRVAAAMALSRADSVMATAALQNVFMAVDEAGWLSRLAVALQKADALGSTSARCASGDATTPPPLTPSRLHAITRLDPVLGIDLFLDLAGKGHLRDATLGAALTALRTARIQRTPASLLPFLPPVVAALLP